MSASFESCLFLTGIELPSPPNLYFATVHPPPQIEEEKGKSALPSPEEAAATAAAAAPKAAAAAPAAPKSEAVPIGRWEPVAADTQRENGGKGGGGSGAARGAPAAVAAETGSSAAGVFGVGARVEVLSGDKWYPAVSAVYPQAV